MHIFKNSKIKIKEQTAKNVMINGMFFGASILEACWMVFGWVSGGRNLGLVSKTLENDVDGPPK